MAAFIKRLSVFLRDKRLVLQVDYEKKMIHTASSAFDPGSNVMGFAILEVEGKKGESIGNGGYFP